MLRLAEGALGVLHGHCGHSRVLDLVESLSGFLADGAQNLGSDVRGCGEDDRLAPQRALATAGAVLEDVLLLASVPAVLLELHVELNVGAALLQVICHGLSKLLQTSTEGTNGLSLHLRQSRVTWGTLRLLLQEVDGTTDQGAAILLEHLHAPGGSLGGQIGWVSCIDAADERIDQPLEGFRAKVAGDELFHRLLAVGHGVLDANRTQPSPDLAGPREEVAKDCI
mmetsp:Transcript_6403/g.13997  ORF Transcript_6403/g.13997 Transcript_6403/m.13997 type:complete len:225 (-) Transcript_6403:705-1379(-)